MNQLNFLIGRGHLLTHKIPPPGGGGSKEPVYSFEETIERLKPEFISTSEMLNQVPDEACPGDYAVARMVMHPAFIARSFFPTGMLRATRLESVGSRMVKVAPRKWNKKGAPKSCSTTELFVAGKRGAFRNLAAWASQISEDSKEAKELMGVESFHAFTAQERIAALVLETTTCFEVGIHLLPEEDFSLVYEAFFIFASQLGVDLSTDHLFRVGNLLFIPVHCPASKIKQLAQFTLIRVIRPMPKLRGMRPLQRNSGIQINCNLPHAQPLSSEPKVAILDGGLPEKHSIHNWLRGYRKSDSQEVDDPDALEHGLGVTSAFLFGPIEPGGIANRPYSFVDHYRVLDRGTQAEDPLELYRTLGFIEEILLSRQYQFINLSLGPDLPVEDSDVHAWTALIDRLLSDGNTLMTVAVGNNGERDWPSGNARVMVPSDCVNALAVGAASETSVFWERAPYSAIGPGRHPGLIKPDLMMFGGTPASYFHVLCPGVAPTLTPQLGTSFAAPYLLRNAVGIRAIQGDALSPLAIKALLVHSADPGSHEQQQVGFGKIPEDVRDIITCPNGVARIVYEGELTPGKYLRAPVPMPKGGLSGNIVLKATFCYASPTDPQDAVAYTRAGLKVTFRADTDNGATNARAQQKGGFFGMKKYQTEAEQRSDAGKWETVLHGAATFQGSEIPKPAFDIHYNARDCGASTQSAQKIRYALIITVASYHTELSADILEAYKGKLVRIEPKITIPIRL